MSYNISSHLETNLEAIKIALNCFYNNHKASEYEKDVLQRYSGFGGLKVILNDPNDISSWKDYEKPHFNKVNEFYSFLKQEIPEKDYKSFIDSLKTSTLTAYYTPMPIIKAFSDTLQENQIPINSFLDPCSGNGAFMEAFSGFYNISFTAYEKDILTGMILSALHDDKKIYMEGFEEIKQSFSSQFDLISSNIPFGDFKAFDHLFVNSRDTIKRLSCNSIHNYFFVKALDISREGGLVAFITTDSFMSSPSHEALRLWCVRNSNLVSAIKLPNNLFTNYAGTSVGTDFIVLQKTALKKEISNREKQFVRSFKDPDLEISRNNYFSLSNIVHTSGRIDSDQYGKKAWVYIHDGSFDDMARDMKSILLRDFQHFSLELYYKNFVSKSNQSTSLSQPAQGIKPENIVSGNPFQYDLFSSFGQDIEQQKKNEPFLYESTNEFLLVGNFVFIDNKPHVVDSIDVNRFTESTKVFVKAIEQNEFISEKLALYCKIRDSYNALYHYELNTKKENESLRKDFNNYYDEFVERFGNLNKKNNLSLILTDKSGKDIVAIEKWENNEYQKTDIFFTPVAFSKIDTQNFTANDALLDSLNRFANVNIEHIKNITGQSENQILIELKERIYYNPLNKNYELREKILRGNIVKKLEGVFESLQQNPTDKKIEDTYFLLLENQPEKIPFELILFNLGMNWIPLDIYQNFCNQIMDAHVDISYSVNMNEFKFHCSSTNETIRSEYAVRSDSRLYDGIDMLSYAFTDNSPNITKTLRDPLTGKDYKVPDNEKIQLAITKIERIREKFQYFLQNLDDDKKEYLSNLYNVKFNNTIKPIYDGSHQVFPNLRLDYHPNAKSLYQSQKDAVWMLLQNEGGLVNHEVGGGKTLIMCIASYEMKRLGIAHKPMIVAKKANVQDIASDFKTIYPDARVLYPSEKDFSSSNREKLFNTIKNNSWDCIIITHDQFSMIPQSAAKELEFLQGELENIEMDLSQMLGGDKASKALEKGLLKRKENLTFTIKAKQEILKNRKDDVVDFHTMGIDHLLVDESHVFKNLMFTTRHTRVAGLGNMEGSLRALNFMTAIRTIQDNKDKEYCVSMFSGTPISNSMTELYTIFRYMRPNTMREQGVYNFDSWAAQFARKSRDYEFSVTNELIIKERFRNFINVPELSLFLNTFQHYQSAKMIGVDRPEMNPVMVMLDPTSSQLDFIPNLIQFAKNGDGTLVGIGKLEDSQKQAKMLLATNLAKKMSLDMRLINSEEYQDDQNNKIHHCAKNIREYYDKFSEHKGTQIVFSDLGTYNSDKWNVYSELKSVLVNQHSIPSNEIRFIHECKNKADREALFNKVRSGEVRVIIGSTEMLGTGVNIQDRVIAEHHFDLPWKPSSMDQRIGRAQRKGNWLAKNHNNNQVDILIYTTKRTLDNVMFQFLQNKQFFISQIYNYQIGSRMINEGNCDEHSGMNFNELAAELSGSTEILQKAKLEKKIMTLESEKLAFYKDKSNAFNKIEKITAEISQKQNVLKHLSEDLKCFNSLPKVLEHDTDPLQDKDNIKPKATTLIQLKGLQSDLVKEVGEKIIKCRDIDSMGQENIIGSLGDFKIGYRTSINDMTLFKETNFFIKNALTYTHLGGHLSTENPQTACNFFYNAIKRIPELYNKYTSEVQQAEKSIEDLKHISVQKWGKESELDSLQQEVKALDKIIQDTINNKNKKEFVIGDYVSFFDLDPVLSKENKGMEVKIEGLISEIDTTENVFIVDSPCGKYSKKIDDISNSSKNDYDIFNTFYSDKVSVFNLQQMKSYNKFSKDNNIIDTSRL